MGCDIHDYCEVKFSIGWEMLDSVFDNLYYKNGKCEHPYGRRNYSLFGMLADVRSEIIPPLSQPKGVPSDASKEYLNIVDHWNGDGHSHSYFTLQELLDYQFYNETVKMNVCVSSDEYKVFKKDGKPTSWCGGASGYNVVNITNNEMDEYLSNSNEFIKENAGKFLHDLERSFRLYSGSPAHKHILENIAAYKKNIMPQLSFYTNITWGQSVKDCIGKDWFSTLEKLKTLAPDFNRIRMVFFFDN